MAKSQTVRALHELYIHVAGVRIYPGLGPWGCPDICCIGSMGPKVFKTVLAGGWANIIDGTMFITPKGVSEVQNAYGQLPVRLFIGPN